ncbi:hypothetical protein GCM10023083_20630 [Streptomyces phyllanthi]
MFPTLIGNRTCDRRQPPARDRHGLRVLAVPRTFPRLPSSSTSACIIARESLDSSVPAALKLKKRLKRFALDNALDHLPIGHRRGRTGRVAHRPRSDRFR